MPKLHGTAKVNTKKHNLRAKLHTLTCTWSEKKRIATRFFRYCSRFVLIWFEICSRQRFKNRYFNRNDGKTALIQAYRYWMKTIQKNGNMKILIRYSAIASICLRWTILNITNINTCSVLKRIAQQQSQCNRCTYWMWWGKKNHSDTQFTHKHTEMVQHEPTKRKSRSLFKHSRRGVIDTRIKVHIRF